MEWRLLKLNQITIGWIRRRLRACIWKQWKLPRTKCKNFVRLGIDKHKAYQYSNTRKGYWRIDMLPL